MSSYALFALLTFSLSAIGVLCLLLAFFYPKVSRHTQFNRRLELLSATSATKSTDKRPRRRSVDATLREAEERIRAKRSKPTLIVRMRQAQITWSKSRYYLVCLIVGLTAFFVVGTTGLGKLPALGFAISAGLLLPHWYVNIKRSRRFNRFLVQFGNAIDVIVRGVKVGVPLGDCIKMVAAEGQCPIKDEFKIITDDQVLGVPLADAAERLPERIPLAEARFFSIVIAMQSRSGGNLSEVLGNLSKVLRERQKMHQKVKALSSEANASAIIFGSLPVFAAAILYLIAPQYVSLLITTGPGNAILVCCGLWMLIGCLVMRKMINFEV